MPKSYRLRIVDVFTEKQLAGNPLAVVLAADDISAETMQAVARETNLSETTFVLRPEKSGAARVRIFTPHAELPFAGHPTIGTAWVLIDEGAVDRKDEEFTLEEKIGPVPVRVERSGEAMVLWMTHPVVEFGQIIEARGGLAEAMGLTEDDLMADIPIQVASTGVPFLYVALRDRAAVDRARSNGEALTRVLERYQSPPVLLFAANGTNRVYSRMFGPHSLTQIMEDPATGSASGPLGAFAVKYGIVRRQSTVRLVSEQGTRMGRQSFIHIRLRFQDSRDVPVSIEVGGSVVPVITGMLGLPA